jgi:hypothetical protein
MKNLAVVWLCLVVLSNLLAQSSKDSLLANERTMDRPINVHKGQVRVSGGYGFEYISKRFDDDGESVELKKDGQARAHHLSYLQVKFGLLEFLQLNAQAGYQAQNVRYPQNVVVGYPDLGSNTSVSMQNRIAGLEDLSLGLDFRLPLRTRKIDIMLSTAATLPIAGFQQKQPENKLQTEPNFWQVEYNYVTPMGHGVSMFQFGGATKFRLKNWAITLMGDYKRAFTETTRTEWTHQINDDEQFEYQSSEYRVSLPGQIQASVMIEYQPSSIVNLFLEAGYLSRTNGWRETNLGKEKLPDEKYISMGPGFEIIVTPRIWFREAVSLPISGAHTERGVQFLSTLSYNLFIY